MSVESNFPTREGVYAAKTWTGWKILEWHDKLWKFPGGHSRWGGEVDAHVFLEALPNRKPAALEFDL